MAISMILAVAVWAVVLALALMSAGMPVAARGGHARTFPTRDSQAKETPVRDGHAAAPAARLGGFALFRRHPFNEHPVARWTLAAGAPGSCPPSAPAAPGVAAPLSAAARRAAPAPQRYGPP